MKNQFDLNLHNLALFNAVCEDGIYGTNDDHVTIRPTPEGLQLEMDPKGNTLFSYLMYREHAVRFNSDEIFWPLDVNVFPYCVLEYKVIPAKKDSKYPRVAGKKTKNAPMLIYFRATGDNQNGLGFEILPVKYEFHQETIDLRHCFEGIKNPKIYMLYFFLRNFFSEVSEKIEIKQISFRKNIDPKKHVLKPTCDIKKDLARYPDVDLNKQYSWVRDYYHFGVNSPRAANRDTCKQFKINLRDYYNHAFRDQALHGITMHWFLHDEADDELKTILGSAKTYNIDVVATLKNPLPLENLTHFSDLSFDEKKYERIVKDTVKEFKKYDNMKFWFLTDEPVDKIQLATYLKAKQYIEKHDKNRPCIFNLSLPHFIHELGNKTAVHMFDSYPVIEPGPNFWRVGPEVDFAVKNTDQPVWTVLQTFERRPRFRMPTNSESDVMSNLALLNGTSGLNYHIYANYPWSMQPNYGACLINVFGKAHPLWDHLGIYGRILYGFKNVVANRTPLKNNVTRIESPLFEAMTGHINSVEANLFAAGNHKILFVMNQNPHKQSTYILHPKNATTCYKIVVRDILPDAGKSKVVSFTPIQPGKKIRLKAGEASWIIVGNATDATTFCDQVRMNLLDLEHRMACTYADQYSGLKSKASQNFIDQYKQQLSDASPSELESLLRFRHRFIADAQRQNPHVAKIKNRLLAIQDQLSELDEQLCTPNIPFKSEQHQKIVSILHNEGKTFLELFHLKTLYDKNNFATIDVKLKYLQKQITKKQ